MRRSRLSAKYIFQQRRQPQSRQRKPLVNDLNLRVVIRIVKYTAVVDPGRLPRCVRFIRPVHGIPARRHVIRRDQLLQVLCVRVHVHASVRDHPAVPRGVEIARATPALCRSKLRNQIVVRAACIANRMKRLMHIANEMHDELQRLLPFRRSLRRVRQHLLEECDPIHHTVQVIRCRSGMRIGRLKAIAPIVKSCRAPRNVHKMPVVRLLPRWANLIRPVRNRRKRRSPQNRLHARLRRAAQHRLRQCPNNLMSFRAPRLHRRGHKHQQHGRRCTNQFFHDEIPRGLFWERIGRSPVY